jgi:hypothetical protein
MIAVTHSPVATPSFNRLHAKSCLVPEIGLGRLCSIAITTIQDVIHVSVIIILAWSLLFVFTIGSENPFRCISASIVMLI